MLKGRIAPTMLIIIGLIILSASLLAYHIENIKQLNSQIQNLEMELTQTQIVLNQTEGELAQVSAALEKERAVVTEGRGVRNFLSLEELKEFLAEDDTDKHEYIKDDFDCDDFALMLQRNAFEKGFIINCQKLPVGGIEHMHNLAICGNDLYYVEARTDTVTYAGFLD